MRFFAIAVDFDGTLADEGAVASPTLDALRRVRDAGRRTVLVTGRRFDDLRATFNELDLFDRVVAENGAIIVDPASGERFNLAPPPPAALIEALTTRGVAPLSVGEAILGTWHPHETTALKVIRDLGLPYHVIFNKGAVMLIPSGVNKATGLVRALRDLDLSTHNTLAVGDAENDLEMFAACELAVAVSNALPTVREAADWVTHGDHGAGVVEVLEALSDTEESALPRSSRTVIIGHAEGSEVRLRCEGPVVLVCGSPAAGKSTFAAGLADTLIDRGYQCCIIDPEGDYPRHSNASLLGSNTTVPTAALTMELLRTPLANAVINLLPLAGDLRQEFLGDVLERLEATRRASGRPHWLFLDEAHHMLYPPLPYPGLMQTLRSTVLVTVDPGHVDRAALERVTHVVAVGHGCANGLAAFCRAVGVPIPDVQHKAKDIQAIVWDLRDPQAREFVPAFARKGRPRHARKYAEGDMGPVRSFYFHEPGRGDEKRARNLIEFADLALTIADSSWLFHLERGDYSRWIRDCVGDTALADEISAIETDPREVRSRRAVRDCVLSRYGPPA
jgi:hydroxymethylpyrimidine pyrophosphatase-like HAD family hydrolase